MSGSSSSPPADSSNAILTPPHTLLGILGRLGPGLIIAGSIVGSGELIGTTKTGAEAGFVLLWLILIGCGIKVFAQIEFGRYTLINGQTSIEGMSAVPGPRWRVGWLVWVWVLMFLPTVGQLGGIVGGVGQALAITVPVTGDFQTKLELEAAQKEYDHQLIARLKLAGLDPQEHHAGRAAQMQQAIELTLAKELGPRATVPTELSRPRDDVYWSALVTMLTAIMLVLGRYTLVQNVSTALVASFTAVTIACLVAQQFQPQWAVHASDIAEGLSFRLPSAVGGVNPLGTALATFGIIGVGANELIAYPYWCLEKGYAGFTGPRDASESWAVRARGWMRVMRWDAWCSMLIYTFATLAFYLLGAGVLHRQGLNPAKDQMIRTLIAMYEPTFGHWADEVFLCGAFAVLYSTFFAAIAGHARVCADAVRVFGWAAASEAAKARRVRWLSGVLPFLSFGLYLYDKDPVAWVLLGGFAQAIMLPLLGVAAVWFRYRRCDGRIAPGRTWDGFLWLSVLGLFVAGAWCAYANLETIAAKLGLG